MYILKNAFRNILRSKGRNILIGIIVFVISVSLCIGLSIRQAAVNARETALDGLSVTAQISVDRSQMMKNAGQPDDNNSEKPKFDKSDFKGFSDSLSIDELKTYAKASTVNDFYYTITTSLDASGDLDPVTNSDSSTQTSQENQQEEQGDAPVDMPNSGMHGGDMGGMQGSMSRVMRNGDFSIIGYSGDNAMTDFVSGVNSITDGAVFEQGTESYDCIISEELATYNSLSVDDKITLTNPNNEEETYTLTIKGIYKSSSADNQNGMAQMFSAADQSNEIYMSSNAVQKIIDNSSSNAVTTTDDDGRETSTKVFSQTNGTYVFNNVEDY